MTKREFYKKSILIIALMIILIACMIGSLKMRKYGAFQGNKDVTAKAAVTSGSAISDVRGVWIAFCDYKNAGLYNKSESVFRKNADSYFAKMKNNGINTIYFHVVPSNDAIYPSSYLKWSHYMFENDPGYDPLQILVETAHKYDLSFQAWLNPYRKKIGKPIFDPGKTSSTNRIVRIVKEILENYDVDGIHFDDYFYPSKTRGAQLSKVSIAKRKANINKMVKKVYQTVKSEKTDADFSISPSGNIEYAESLGCDLSTWMNTDGYVDYIVPQIYWSDNYRVGGKKVKMYSDRLEQWIELNEGGLPMVIGLGLYRGGSYSSSDRGWHLRNDNIVAQIKKERKAGCQGFVLFSSSYFFKSACKKEVANYKKYIKTID